MFPDRSVTLAEPWLFFLSFQSMDYVVGPVELWATRERRPSAAANPQGFLGRLSGIGEVVFRAIADDAGLATAGRSSRVD
jgi:hypothetical protein